MAKEFKDSINPNKKVVMAGAVNPDGNSIMLAF